MSADGAARRPYVPTNRVRDEFSDSHRPPLQLGRHAYECASPQGKTPRKMRGPGDADAFIRDDIERFICFVDKAMPRIRAQIHFVMSMRDIQRLGEFARPGTESSKLFYTTASFHESNALTRFKRTNQHKAINRTLNEHV